MRDAIQRFTRPATVLAAVPGIAVPGIAALALAALAVAALPTAAGAAGGTPSPTPEVTRTPQEEAVEHYNRGLEYRDEARELEAEAEEADEEKRRRKLEKKAAKKYRNAADEMRSATEKNPDMHQAWSSLGYALRRLGRYEEALDAYDRALEIEPGYAEAIEYRAEAHLALGNLEEVKSAYIDLFSGDRGRADELMAAIGDWLEQKRADGGIEEEPVREFAAWVEERRQIAEQTAALYPGDGTAEPAWE